MGSAATSTAKEIVRIATTHGLAKDVIDLLEKKATLLAEQVAGLEQENRNLKLENESLKNQLPYAKPKGELSEQAALILKYFFAKARNGASNKEIAHYFKIVASMAAHHLDTLKKKKFIDANMAAFIDGRAKGEPLYQITAKGRAHCVENGLVS